MKFQSDHYVHLKYINSFKLGKKRFGDIIKSHYNQSYAVYPLLYHYMIAKLSYSTAINKPNRINFFIQIISCFAFNSFVYWYTDNFVFVEYLLLNLIFFLFPFSYAFWNAKNSGLSARGFGLLTGQLYTYSLFIYLTSGSSVGYAFMIIFSLFSLLGSQFSFQYVFFISIVSSLITFKFEIILPLLISLILFRITFSDLFKNYILGQFNHKKNYFLYLAPIFIMKYRPNIYRDFIYDFWIKLAHLKTEKTKAFLYIYTNPIVELIYGFPFLWVSLYFVYDENHSIISNPLLVLIGAALIIFFIISFNFFRFLGEPQRYLEFLIPIITLLFWLYTPSHVQWILIVVSAFFIVVTTAFFKQHRKSKLDNQRLIQFLINHYNKEKIIASNDTNFIKFLSPYFNVVTTDLTESYANKKDFYFYHKNDYAIQSIKGLMKHHKTHKLNILVIKHDFYSKEEQMKLNKVFNLLEVENVGGYSIYEIIHV